MYRSVQLYEQLAFKHYTTALRLTSDLELAVSFSTQCFSLKKNPLYSLMKLKLFSLERHWFWLNFWGGDFFIVAWIWRGNKIPVWKGKCPPGWMNCRLGETRLGEEGFGHSHMPSKATKTAQVVIAIFILLFIPVVILNGRCWGVFISCES